jgi:RimJ/RimL family protein N-acetyltransferase
MNLHLYKRGHFPRETLGTLWNYVEEQGAAKKLFYAQPNPPTPVGTVGDLTAFVEYFGDEKRVVLIVEEGGEVMGMVWFDDILPGHRAAINGFYRRRYWGIRAREATRQAMLHAFESLSIKSLWAYTPWPEAVRHAQAIGMELTAVLKEFVLVEGQPRDVNVLVIRKGDLDG